MLKLLKWGGLALALVIAPPLTSDEHAMAQRAPVSFVQKGKASWYGPRFHGRRTANGERFNQHALTAAHRKLPLGTIATVTNLRNGKSVQVRINDRGPYVGNRIIDLSKAAAQQIGLKDAGVVPVRLQVIELPDQDKSS